MTWQQQPQGQQLYLDPNQTQYNSQNQQPYPNQYSNQNIPAQGYNQQYPYQQQAYSQYQNYPQQTSYAPRPKIQQQNKLWVIFMAIVCGSILLVAIAASLANNQANPMTGKAKIQNFKVYYNLKPAGTLQTLDSITVYGNVSNTGSKDIKLNNINLRCDGDFLTNPYASNLDHDAIDPGDHILKSGETVAFHSNLGTVRDKTSSTQDWFEIYDGQNYGNSWPIDVSPYYK
jgi:hypothetical protein